MKVKKYASLCLNFLVGIFSLLGVTLACVFAERDGYSYWYKKLYYFTQQSNVWIGVTCLSFAILTIVGQVKKTDLVKNYVYVLKFIFTVSITVTGLIFCALLAPFADFDVWTFSSVLTHVVVPTLAIADFFIADIKAINNKCVYLALIPPAVYFVFASILCVLKVDFGRGDAFPYFFMNFYSQEGLFGFTNGSPPQFGSVYWLIFMLGLFLGLGFLYYKLHPSTRGKIKNKDKIDV